MGRLNYERTPARTGELQLDRMRRLLQQLDQPQVTAPVIHLAGTKGKGSTAAIISHLLAAAGRQVGLYTSPHLSRLEERIQLNNQPCSADQFVDLVSQIHPVVRRMDQAGDPPTFFELSTALAMLHFAQSQADIVVLETGLGGRLDSTNVCEPVVSVITSISMDHTKQLGDSLDKIAYEKCGIIKPGRPVVSGVTAEPARGVIREAAMSRGCPLVELGVDFEARDVQLTDSPPSTQFTLHHGSDQSVHLLKRLPRHLTDLQVGLLGSHQAVNAANALAALAILESECPELYQHDEPRLRNALAQVRWPARIELACKNPVTIIDVAHNSASAQALADTIEACFPRQKLRGPRTLLAAISNDKDVSAILEALLPCFDHIIFTRFVTNPRAVPPAQLQAMAKDMGAAGTGDAPTTEVCESPTEAWELARSRTAPGDDSLTCIAGSFFLAAELHEKVRESPWV